MSEVTSCVLRVTYCITESRRAMGRIAMGIFVKWTGGISTLVLRQDEMVLLCVGALFSAALQIPGGKGHEWMEK